MSRPHPHNWKGGRVVASNGYMLVHVGKDHPLADVRGYAYEHRLVAEAALGRPLAPGEVVHHRDHDKQNNHPDNLEVVNRAEHGVAHRTVGKATRLPNEPNPIIACACGCGAEFRRYDAANRRRAYWPGHNSQAAPTQDAILAALAAGPMRRPELVRAVGATQKAVVTALSKLKLAGVIVNEGRGIWKKAG